MREWEFLGIRMVAAYWAVLIALVLALQSAFSAYEFLTSTTGTATAWSNHKYITRASDANNIYIVFVSDGNVKFSRSTNDGTSWLMPATSINTEKNLSSSSVNPYLAIDSNDVLHLVWNDNYYGNQWEVFYKSCDSNAKDCTNVNNWSPAANISNTSAASLYPFIAIDSNRRLHIVWNEGTEIYYSKCDANCSDANNWSADINISNDAADSWNPSLSITSDNNIHAVWEDLRYGSSEILYKTCASDCNGYANWSADINISNSADFESYYARLIRDSRNGINIVWSDANSDWRSSKLLYRRCGGDCGNASKWSSINQITDYNIGYLNEDASLTIDSSDNVYALYLTNEDGNGYEVKYRKRSSTGAWGSKIALTNDPSSYKGISCSYRDFNSYGKLDCVWTDENSTKLVYFQVAVEDVNFSTADIGNYKTTHADVAIRADALPDSAMHTISVTEHTIYSPNTYGTASIPWFYEFSTDMANYTFSLRMIFQYLDADNDGYEDLSGYDETKLRIAYWTGAQWVFVPGTIDANRNRITITGIDHFSPFAVFAKTGVDAADLTQNYAKPGTANLAVLDVNIAEGAGLNDVITSMNIRSGNTDDSDINAVMLYLDNDDNVFDASSDALMGSGDFNGGVARFSIAANDLNGSGGIRIDANSMRRIFVAYGIANSAKHGNTLDAYISAGDINMLNAGTNVDAVNPEGYAVVDGVEPSISITGAPKITKYSGAHTIAYSADDSAGVKEYFVRVDYAEWINNGTAESYALNFAVGKHDVEVIATDNADNNGYASMSVEVIQIPSSPGSPPITTQPEAEMPAPSTSTVSEFSITYAISAEERSELLARIGIKEEAAIAMLGYADAIAFERRAIVNKITDSSGNANYNSNLTLIATNTSDEILYNVEIVEEIPKELAGNADEIESETAFIVIEPDPIIKWIVPVMMPGEQKEIAYRINAMVDENLLKGIRSVALFGAEELPEETPNEPKRTNTQSAPAGFASMAGSSAIGVLLVVLALAGFYLRRRQKRAKGK